MDAFPTRHAHTQFVAASGHHRQASSTRPSKHAPAFDLDSSHASSTDPPHKLRKTQAHGDKSKGIGIGIGIGIGTSALDSALQASPWPPEEIANLPYPTHHPRTPAPDLSPIRSAFRKSLKNGSLRTGIPPAPTDAPRHAGGLCDYLPWERKHREDVLTEPVTRAGYYEKAQNSSTELNSARASIISCVRNKTACTSLSDLIVAAFQRRQQLCSVSAKNTFKPPPRVTLTDNKREAWLRDLSDSAIPLRRLSRTIPHGIRGKTLLNHCLAKHVPTWRAVWLVKCVGSNEIRACRRKGTAQQSFGGRGETQWLKEWTQSVLQFLDSLPAIPNTDKPEGREHLAYALSLVSHAYHDHLVDQDLFTQSIIARLCAVSVTKVGAFAFWLSLVGQYLADALACCHRGCDLAKGLLSKLEHVQASNSSLSIAEADVARQKCSALLIRVLSIQPTSLVFPDAWGKWSLKIESLMSDQEYPLADLFGDLQRRNMALSIGDACSRSARQSGGPLDVFDAEPEPENFISAFQRLSLDGAESVKQAIGWCTSSKRAGLASIYLVARVLRMVSKKLAYSCQDDIASMLASVKSSGQVQARRLYMLAAELVRSRHFSLSRYLNFLIARGMSSLCEKHLAIFSFVPRQTLSNEVLNLASSLCATLKCSLMPNKEEADFQVAAMQLAISKCRPTSGLASKDHVHVSKLDAGTRSTIALHLRKDIATKRAEQSYPSPDENESMDLDPASLQACLPATLTAFELLQDFPTLADVLLLFTPKADLESLNLLASCVKCHRLEFQAMSALHQLFADMLKRYALLYQDGLRDRDLTKSLIEVARLLPDSRQTLLILDHHYETLGAETSAIACSPVSDQMLDTIQSQDVRSLGDLTVLLQTGNVISEELLRKMLHYLMRVLESAQQDPEQMSNALKLLRNLADLDKSGFSSFLAKYLHGMLSSKDVGTAHKMLPWIVAGELCPMDELFAGCLRLASDSNKKQMAAQMASNILVSLASPPIADLCNCVQYYYAFCAMQRELLETKRDTLARLAELALLSTPRSSTAATTGSDHDFALSCLTQIVSTLLCKATDQPDLAFEDTLLELYAAGAPIENMLCGMVNLIPEGREADEAIPVAPITLLHKVTEVAQRSISGPCRLLAQIELRKLEQSNAPKDTLQLAASIFISESSAWMRLSCWPELLRHVSVRMATLLHEHALGELLATLTMAGPKNDACDVSSIPWDYLRNLLLAIEATCSKLTVQCVTNSFDRVSKTLEEFATTLESRESDNNAGSGKHDSDAQAVAFEHALCILLRLVSVHVRHLTNAGTEGSGDDKLITLVNTLSAIFLDLHTTSLPTESTERILLDLIFYGAALLPETQRAKCSSSIHEMYDSLPQPLCAVLGPSECNQEIGGFFIETDEDLAYTAASPGATPRAVLPKQLFNVDPWEMLQDTTPIAGLNDACLNLSLLGARKYII